MHQSLERAWQLYRVRRYPLALEETVKFLCHHPESAEAHCLCALIHGKEKRQTAAIAAAEAAIRYSPDWSYPHYVHGLVAYWFNKYQSALKSLSEALRIQPTDPDFYEIVSAIHAEQGNLETSLLMANKGLGSNPEHVGCLYHQGVALYNLNRLSEAEAVFRNILTIDAEHSPSQGFVGIFEMQQGRFDQALPLLRRALRDNPDWEFAQNAWKESLRGQYPSYGAVVRLRQWIFEKYKWNVFVTIVLIIFPVAYYWSNPNKDDFIQLIPAVIIGIAGITFLIFWAVFLILTGYLSLISRLLLVTDRELRRSFDWTETFKDFRNTLLIFIGIVVVMFVVYFMSK